MLVREFHFLGPAYIHRKLFLWQRVIKTYFAYNQGSFCVEISKRDSLADTLLFRKMFFQTNLSERSSDRVE